MVRFSDILTTQLSIRHGHQIPGMSEFVRAGGKFTRAALDEYAYKQRVKPSPLVQINRFEDDRLCLLDGHHRGVGILEAGRDFFYEEEIQFQKYTYSDFTDIVFLHPDGTWMGWVTPFDPRKSVRLSNTGQFKDDVYNLYWSQSPQHAKHLILTRPELYKQDRIDLPMPVDNLEQMRELWGLEAYTLLDGMLASKS